MNLWKKCSSLILLLSFALTLSASHKTGKTEMATQPSLEANIRRFAPTTITADISRLSAGDRQALPKIIEAARLLDPLFLRQVWSGNDALLKKLEQDKTPQGRERLHYFKINNGPWSRLDSNEPVIEGVPREKPPGGNFYPADMTKQEFETWAATLSPEDKERATGFFYTIRRNAGGKLMTVPYNEEYKEFLVPAAKLLREAAALTTNATLKDFLMKRADAFASNDYYASDVAWMDLDAPIDVTIGPYETYEDELFSYKAAFEAYINLRDDAESAKLAKFSKYLQELEDHLPIDARYRNPKLGAASPIRVVNEVFASGEGNSGVQTAAFNLPNDERVVKEKGSKRIMLKNVQDAKFNKTLIPISRVVLTRTDQAKLSFDSFFTHILTHELMHEIGPHNINVDGQATTVRLQLKDKYSSIEEAKADVTGLWALQYLINKGVVPKTMQRTLYTTYLASMFRSVRFGINEAHGAYEKAAAILDKYAVIRAPMKGALDNLKSVPVDIEPVFPLAK